MESVANIGQSFKAEFERQVEAEYSKLSRANVLIAGHTGAGKSKLINAVLGAELARVGSGAPVTDCYTRYSVNSVPVVIFDAKGWEGGTEKELLFFADTERFLAEHRSSDSDSRIHVIWYVVDAPGARFTDFDERLIRVAFRDIPILVVLSKCDIAADEQIQALRDEIAVRQLTEVIDVVEVAAAPLARRAEPRLPPFGLGELVTVTTSRLPELVRKAFISAQRVNFDIKRKTASKEIVAFASGAFAIGFNPLPFADAALLVPLQAAMAARVAVIYGYRKDEMIVVMAASLAGSTFATVCGTTLANLLKLLPGLGTMIGGFINGTVGASLTAAMGFAFSSLFYEIGQRTLAGDETTLTAEWAQEFLHSQFLRIWQILKGKKRLDALVEGEQLMAEPRGSGPA